MRSEFEQMFGAGELFVEPKAFRAWLATAKLKASGLTSADAIKSAVQAFDQRTVAPKMAGDVAVIGNWDPDGIGAGTADPNDEIGIYQPSTNSFILDLNDDHSNAGDATFGGWTGGPEWRIQ